MWFTLIISQLSTSWNCISFKCLHLIINSSLSSNFVTGTIREKRCEETSEIISEILTEFQHNVQVYDCSVSLKFTFHMQFKYWTMKRLIRIVNLPFLHWLWIIWPPPSVVRWFSCISRQSLLLLTPLGLSDIECNKSSIKTLTPFLMTAT